MTMLTQTQSCLRECERRRYGSSRSCTRLGHTGSYRVGILALDLGFDVLLVVLVVVTVYVASGPVFTDYDESWGSCAMLALCSLKCARLRTEHGCTKHRHNIKEIPSFLKA